MWFTKCPISVCSPGKMHWVQTSTVRLIIILVSREPFNYLRHARCSNPVCLYSVKERASLPVGQRSLCQQLKDCVQLATLISGGIQDIPKLLETWPVLENKRSTKDEIYFHFMASNSILTACFQHDFEWLGGHLLTEKWITTYLSSKTQSCTSCSQNYSHTKLKPFPIFIFKHILDTYN